MAPAIAMPVYSTAAAPLEFSGYSPDQISEMLSKRFGMHEFLLNNGTTRPYITTGKKPNLPGWVLYLFEHEGRDTTIPVICANGELSERSASAGLGKLNEILYPVFHLKIERVRGVGNELTDRIRLSSVDDAKAATDEFLDKFRKAQREYGRTCEAFAQVDPERARLLMDQAIEQRLAAGVWSDKDAADMNSFRRALAPTGN
jgi:hypothetical protein